MPLNPVTAIQKLPDGSYLILQEGYARVASVLSVATMTASHMSFVADSFAFRPIPYEHPYWSSQEGFKFGDPILRLENYIGVNAIFRYEAADSSLYYQFGFGFVYCCGKDSAMKYTGRFQFQAGNFVHQSEEAEVVEGY